MEESISSMSDSYSGENIPLTSSSLTRLDNNSNANLDLKLSWENLNVWCSGNISKGFWKGNQTQRVQILHNVNGCIKSGSLTAIMGPSGSGKTTLLAAISMRVRGDMTGKMLLNGYSISQKCLLKISGFVPQDDLTYNSLTVAEHMLFMANMKMDRSTNNLVRKRRIKELIREMGLSKCSKTKVEGISGGEKRRLSLAVQLINDPPILFCDEPTTGLDSFAAASVVGKLRTLAESGRAVVCVLHQPASDTYQLFHKLILLSNGKVAYHGPLSGANQFFKKQGFLCPVGYNESEFLVNVISEDRGSKEICCAWEMKSQLARPAHHKTGYHELANGKPLFKKNTKIIMNGEAQFQHYLSLEKPTKLVQFYWLLWRSIKTLKNNRKLYIMEFLSLMSLAVIISIPYLNIMDRVEQEDIQNIQGLMYLIVTEMIFTSIYSVFNTFSSEVPIFLREVANELYTPAPYYLSKVVVLIPKSIIEGFLYTCFVYWVVGLKGGFVEFMIFTIPVIFAANGANAYGSWLSTSFESIETASLVSVPIDFIAYLFIGTYINLNSVAAYVGWMRYLSVFFYSAEAVSILQWKQINNIECDPRPDLPCVNNGKEVLRNLGYGDDNFNIDLLGMFGIYMGFHILAFVALWRRSKRQPVY